MIDGLNMASGPKRGDKASSKRRKGSWVSIRDRESEGYIHIIHLYRMLQQADVLVCRRGGHNLMFCSCLQTQEGKQGRDKEIKCL